MLKRLFFFGLMICLIFSCDEKKNDDKDSDKTEIESSRSERISSPHKSEDRQVYEESKLAKPADSINNKNTVRFLEKYGALNPETQLVLKTRLGDIGLRLYEDTPLHRASFVFLAKVGYFDTTCFYRVVPDFIIQGGESERLDTQRYKARYMRYKIPPEFRDNRKHKYGALALARDWVNNPQKKSTAFEFYIVQNRKGAHHLDGEHTVFGEVTYGFETIDRIVNLKAGSDEWPLEDVFMKIEVVK
ncbi:MAG: peptidylprolyl isomerase [Lutimonas sp.]